MDPHGQATSRADASSHAAADFFDAGTGGISLNSHGCPADQNAAIAWITGGIAAARRRYPGPGSAIPSLSIRAAKGPGGEAFMTALETVCCRRADEFDIGCLSGLTTSEVDIKVDNPCHLQRIPYALQKSGITCSNAVLKADGDLSDTLTHWRGSLVDGPRNTFQSLHFAYSIDCSDLFAEEPNDSGSQQAHPLFMNTDGIIDNDADSASPRLPSWRITINNITDVSCKADFDWIAQALARVAQPFTTGTLTVEVPAKYRKENGSEENLDAVDLHGRIERARGFDPAHQGILSQSNVRVVQRPASDVGTSSHEG